jgi:heavy metal sensor kinase
MKPFTLRTRLTLAYAAVLSSLLAALAFGYYRVFSRQLEIDATTELAELTRGVRGYLRFDGDRVTISYDRADPGEAAFVQDAARYLQVYEAGSGRLVQQSEALAPLGLRFAPGEIRAFVEQPADFDIRTERRAIRFSNSVVADGEGAAYLVQVGVPLDARDAALGHLLRLFAWSLPAGLVVVAGVGRWMAGGALAPIARLARVARDIGVEDLHRRVLLRGTGDELDELASEFNGVLARLERAVGDMRQFSAAMAHEIRTPLAALRAELETSLSGMRSAEALGTQHPAPGTWHPAPSVDRVASQLEEVDKLTRLVGQLLMLARAEAGELSVAREPVALDSLVRSVVDTLEAVAEAKGVLLACDFPQGKDAIDVMGDRGWLERLLVNLLDNAIKFTPPGGCVTVHVWSDGPAAILAVQDTGAGIPPDWLPSIFDRFWVGPTRTTGQDGAGLGLSLVKWIAEQHGATIRVESRAGNGSLFTVRFPVKGAT